MPPVEPVNTTVTEPKVKAATTVSTGITLVLTIIGAVSDNADLITGLPDWVSVLIAAVLIPAGTFFAGRQAPHQYRAGEGTDSVNNPGQPPVT